MGLWLLLDISLTECSSGLIIITYKFDWNNLSCYDQLLCPWQRYHGGKNVPVERPKPIMSQHQHVIIAIIMIIYFRISRPTYVFGFKTAEIEQKQIFLFSSVTLAVPPGNEARYHVESGVDNLLFEVDCNNNKDGKAIEQP